MNSEIREFRDGIFALRTRRFGTVAELMIEALYNFTQSHNQLTEENAIDICTNSSSTVYDSSEAEARTANYDCNIEQLKPRCFDSLYYGVFFSDKIEVFHAPRSEFPDNVDSFVADKEAARKKLPGYALQHKGGEECQFHIKKTTHKHHRKNYHVKDITYEELYDLFDPEE